ncbi:hypothetical protein Ocin01_00895 [Orchesella cincta]|uniref:Uncharacterized protein n=1 Tax=Orchesella cincta TaxID=48709 RepID=A0A1D2NLI6_ORCCI|nr:hypothetical protein Ocin01_00895 [Orchesella cincta]
MGQITSKAEPTSSLQEVFMRRYLSTHGPTSDTIELIPSGISDDECPPIVRHKFRTAIKRQRQLAQILRTLEDKVSPRRCLSPCMLKNFNVPETQAGNGKNVFNYTWDEQSQRSPRSNPIIQHRKSLTREQVETLGNFGRLVTTPHDDGWHGAEELAALDENHNEIMRGVKRSQSRPEPSFRSFLCNRRQAKSSSLINEGLSSIQETWSDVSIDSILQSTMSERAWPPRELLSKILNDPRFRPTSVFLARFRRNSQESYTEVVYRYSKLTGEDSFEIKGNLNDFLEPDAQRRYEADAENNNTCDKKAFVDNFPYLLNNFDGNIYWNGFEMTVEGNLNKRLTLKSMELEPPSLIFNTLGLIHISATRHISYWCLNGFMEGDEIASKTFIIRGKKPNLKKLHVDRPSDSTDVTILLPSLLESGIPIAKK